jgi:hypothetical protein
MKKNIAMCATSGMVGIWVGIMLATTFALSMADKNLAEHGKTIETYKAAAAQLATIADQMGQRLRACEAARKRRCASIRKATF